MLGLERFYKLVPHTCSSLLNILILRTRRYWESSSGVNVESAVFVWREKPTITSQLWGLLNERSTDICANQPNLDQRRERQ